MPILEVVHILIKCAQCENVFINNFVDAINLVEAELFHLCIYSISNFDGLMFDDFTKLLQHSNDVLFLSMSSNLVKFQKILDFKIVAKKYFGHTHSLVSRCWIKVNGDVFRNAFINENAFRKLVVVMKIHFVETTQTLILELEYEIMMAFGLVYLQY